MQNVLTNAEIRMDSSFPYFKNDIERIKYVSRKYREMNIMEAFNTYYDMKVSKKELDKKVKSINNLQIETIQLGNIYLGDVAEFKKNILTFTLPGVKEEIICKDNFNSCLDHVQNYLLQHNNQLLFLVRQKKNNKYYVSVIDAYYQSWVNNVNTCIKNFIPINVHIDELIRGGYICHLPIDTLVDLTGKDYTHMAFIPGSQIVLNIEHEFEKWIGHDVQIIPQNFVDYYKNFKTGETQRSLVGSRKKLLSIIGINNLKDLYYKYQLINSDVANKASDIEFDGTVTGIINSKDNRGAFIEIDDLYITGLLQIDNPIDLLDYKAGDRVHVKIDSFSTIEGQEPFITNKKGKVIKSNTKVIFKV